MTLKITQAAKINTQQDRVAEVLISSLKKRFVF